MSTVEATEIVPAHLTTLIDARVVEAQQMTVTTPAEAERAVELLAAIAEAKSQNEAARVFLVKPLNDQVKKINAKLKAASAPLDEADQIVRQKVLSYQRQAQEAARVEQERLDAERRAAEEAAEAERRRLAEQAAEAERREREQGEARQAKLREAQNERAREIAAMNDDALADLLAQRLSEGDPEHATVREEIRQREERGEAERRAVDLRRQAEEAQQREIAAASAPSQTATVAPLAAANGAASVRKEWKATVVDRALLPDEYLIVDEQKIRRVVKAGVREIPGVLIEQVDGLSVRATR